MRIIYLIIAHTNGAQVARFARRLLAASPAGAVIVLHGSSEQPDLEPWVAAGRAHLLPYDRPVFWGDFSLVRKVLYGLCWAAERLDFDWLVLLSGQDYLLRPLASLEEELAAAPYDAFISGVPIASGQLCGSVECALAKQPAPACRRCQQLYLYQYWRLPVGKLARMAINWVNHRAGTDAAGLPLLRYQRLTRAGSRVGTLIGVRAATTPFGASFRCYKGTIWFAANRAALGALIGALDAAPGLLAYYRRTILPDESLFVTVLKNAPELRIAENTLHFVNWADAQSASPAVLRAADFERLVASGAYFGRKFDSRVDGVILDRLDAYLGEPATATAEQASAGAPE